MQRRTFGRTVTGISLIGIAGCLDSGIPGVGSEPTKQDSDGDGVSDEEDYAPNDPEVQEAEDRAQSSTPTAKPIPYGLDQCDGDRNDVVAITNVRVEEHIVHIALKNIYGEQVGLSSIEVRANTDEGASGQTFLNEFEMGSGDNIEVSVEMTNDVDGLNEASEVTQDNITSIIVDAAAPEISSDNVACWAH